MTPFQYQTKRAEWVIEVWNHGKLVLTSEPFPTKEEARANQERILKGKPLSGREIRIRYQESVVDIDPILNSAINRIADWIEHWMQNDLIQNKRRSRTIYFGEHKVQSSLNKLARNVRNLIVKH